MEETKNNILVRIKLHSKNNDILLEIRVMLLIDGNHATYTFTSLLCVNTKKAGHSMYLQAKRHEFCTTQSNPAKSSGQQHKQADLMKKLN